MIILCFDKTFNKCSNLKLIKIALKKVKREGTLV